MFKRSLKVNNLLESLLLAGSPSQSYITVCISTSTLHANLLHTIIFISPYKGHSIPMSFLSWFSLKAVNTQFGKWCALDQYCLRCLIQMIQIFKLLDNPWWAKQPTHHKGLIIMTTVPYNLQHKGINSDIFSKSSSSAMSTHRLVPSCYTGISPKHTCKRYSSMAWNYHHRRS